MGLSIKEAAEMSGLTSYTLRYYEKEGLLPFVDRSSTGHRDFKESDMEWISLINCLKATGMSIKDIKILIDLCLEGDSTLEKRLLMFQHQKEIVENQIVDLNKHLEKLNYKIWYYETAVKAGTEDVHKNCSCKIEK